jgi:hypothetical protein
MVQHKAVGEGRSEGATSKRRTTVAEAAQVLGISAEAVRGRIRRGTLPVEREGRTVYVLIDPPPDDRTTTEQPRTTTDQPSDRTDELIATLRTQLEAERQAHAEARRIIAGLVERLPPQIEAPAEQRESPQSAAGERIEPTPSEPPEGPQERAEVRSWWQRLFGGEG